MEKIEAIDRTSKSEETGCSLGVWIDFFSYWDASGKVNEYIRCLHSYKGKVYDTQFMPRILISIVSHDDGGQK